MKALFNEAVHLAARIVFRDSLVRRVNFLINTQERNAPGEVQPHAPLPAASS